MREGEREEGYIQRCDDKWMSGIIRGSTAHYGNRGHPYTCVHGGGSSLPYLTMVLFAYRSVKMFAYFTLEC